MKTLYLLRHAKAQSKDSPVSDVERTLLKQGKAQVEKVARKFKKKAKKPGMIVTSSAARAQESARIFAKTLGHKKGKIVTDEHLYGAGSRTLYQLVKGLDDSQDSAVIVGHNPAFDDFAASLVNGFERDIPISGLVGVDLQVEHWKDVRRGRGVVTYFDFPNRKQEQSKLFKALKKEIESDLAESIGKILQSFDTESADKLKKRIKEASKQIASDFVSNLKTHEVEISFKNGTNGNANPHETPKVELKDPTTVASAQTSKPPKTGNAKSERAKTKSN